MLRPISPFVEYAVNYDYISKVLCVNQEKVDMNCNGKCYVMKQLEQQQEEDFNSLQISIEDYPIGFIELVTIPTTKLLTNTLQKPTFYQQNYSYLADNSVFYPPENFSFYIRA